MITWLENLIGRTYDWSMYDFAISNEIVPGVGTIDWEWVCCAAICSVLLYWTCKGIFHVFGAIFGGV